MANFYSLISSTGKEEQWQDRKQRIDNLPHMVRQKLAIDTGKKKPKRSELKGKK
ncbi:hypothetical protein HPE47_18110 [Escherichia coli]|nr:hypothetical protein HPE47_18110 [Escherichia coli]